MLKLRIRELRATLEESYQLDSIRAGSGEFGAGTEELVRQLDCFKALDIGLQLVRVFDECLLWIERVES